MDSTLQEAAMALRQDWDLQLPDTVSEEEIVKLLAQRIVAILERGPDAFYQLMYRVDISEKKLNAAISDADVALKIAQLVYNRQLEKIRSRREHRAKRENDDPELNW